MAAPKQRHKIVNKPLKPESRHDKMPSLQRPALLQATHGLSYNLNPTLPITVLANVIRHIL
jgi:hypothetical protein